MVISGRCSTTIAACPRVATRCGSVAQFRLPGPDGTTPASRFFRRSFPDLFESVLSQIDELPLPR